MEKDTRPITLDRELIYNILKHFALFSLTFSKMLDKYLENNFPDCAGYSNEEFEAMIKTLTDSELEFLLLKMVE